MMYRLESYKDSCIEYNNTYYTEPVLKEYGSFEDYYAQMEIKKASIVFHYHKVGEINLRKSPYKWNSFTVLPDEIEIILKRNHFFKGYFITTKECNKIQMAMLNAEHKFYNTLGCQRLKLNDTQKQILRKELSEVRNKLLNHFLKKVFKSNM